MKNKILLAAAVAAFTLTSYAAQPLLSPRAAGNQLKVASAAEAPAVAAYVNTTSAQLSPRAAANQIKSVQGIANDTTTAAFCRANMNGSPKAVTECSSHATMPACTKAVAMQ